MRTLGTLGLITSFIIYGEERPAFGHGGGLDAQGCHRDSSTGLRHCHGGGSGGSVADDPPIVSLGGIRAIGFSTLSAALTLGIYAASDDNDSLAGYALLLSMLGGTFTFSLLSNRHTEFDEDVSGDMAGFAIGFGSVGVLAALVWAGVFEGSDDELGAWSLSVTVDRMVVDWSLRF